MSKRRKHARVPPTTKALAYVPTPTATADAAVQLGLKLRNEANLTGRCACGARAELYEVRDDGSLVPIPSVRPGMVVYGRFKHEDDCPAISPALDRAYERGEISDPGGDLMRQVRVHPPPRFDNDDADDTSAGSSTR